MLFTVPVLLLSHLLMKMEKLIIRVRYIGRFSFKNKTDAIVMGTTEKPQLLLIGAN